ncbi:MAG TPA: serine/threonine-protein kinase [Pyrinomonadaceae bacterium]|nr:serine/threonine-protein kinase [Pyrinomonadaceae bacterium]
MTDSIRKLGPYTLISRIGLGGFGAVWLAEKRTAIATTQVALKLPRGEDIDLEAFKQEAAIWVQASGHPNVLPLIDADIYDDQVVIVSEYVPDGSLAGWLKQHGGKAPSAEAACEIMDGVLAGLAHLHARLIIHRDLKPENILLQRETPRLADFGIARLLKSSTHSQKVSGTLAYMAPEAFDGKRNEQTDVWSTGVIFYEMLAGRLPYDQPDIPSFIGAIMRNDPPPLPNFVPEVLRQIVMKALQRDPANRYSSAADMRRDLREAEHRVWLGGREAIVEPQAPTLPAPVLQPTMPTMPVNTVPSILPVKRTLPAETLPLPVPVKENSRLPFWLAGSVAVVLLLLGVLSLVSVYYWRSSRTANKSQTETPRIAKQSQGQYALQYTLTRHRFQIDSIAFSPDGKTFASGSLDLTIKLCDAQTGNLKLSLDGHTEGISSVAFSPDGATLASASRDKTVKLWDSQTGALKQTLKAQDDWVTAVAFSPDGKSLATASDDGSVKLWDAHTGALQQSLAGHSGKVFSVAFAPDGLASAGEDKTVKFWNTDRDFGNLTRILTGHTDAVWSIAFSPDGKTLASGSGDQTVKLWDVQSGTLKQTLPQESAVYVVAFSRDGTMLAMGSYDSKVKLWNLESRTLQQTLTGHEGGVFALAFSPDGKTLASGGVDKTVKVWRAE